MLVHAVQSLWLRWDRLKLNPSRPSPKARTGSRRAVAICATFGENRRLVRQKKQKIVQPCLKANRFFRRQLDLQNLLPK